VCENDYESSGNEKGNRYWDVTVHTPSSERSSGTQTPGPSPENSKR